MNQPRHCPKCGAALPGEAMDGLCPNCAARVLFGEGQGAEPAATVEVETETAVERPGTRIGRYRLLEQIGEGGFGVVYMAEQVEPVQRKVALKIVKAGMDTREVIARFEAERQALALMDHPNIAKVLDGGVVGAAKSQIANRKSEIPLGRPYFVMELVKGIPITDFCDQKKLSPTERLQLFMTVCQAVQHAHQKGIIHRDLKPTNVLVTLHDGTPMPKVIDFGVAKALGQKLTEKTLFTGFAHMLGTPAYMSPEQAELSGLDVDTRSDIYSLGVLLYELLTGVTPLDRETLAKAALDEVRRMIRETEPPRPSTRLRALGDKLTDVASRRHTEPPRLIHFLRGDLDWIVMKCLEKDRRRRYETANALATDVQRHLDDEPIVARPPSAGYRLQKLVRRNKLVFAAGSAVAAALILGLGVATVALFREKAARERAVAAEQHAEGEREHAERLLYASDMNSAFQAIEDYDFIKAHRHLTNHWPGASEPDLRSWEWRYLWQRCQSQELLTLGKHDGFAIAHGLAFSPDGKWLASGGTDGVVKIWDLPTHALAQSLTNGGAILALAFSPDGSQLAVGCCHQLRLWDTRTWHTEDVVQVTRGTRVESVCFTPDGGRLIAMNNRGIGIWQVQGTLKELDRLQRNMSTSPGQHACAISSDGKKLAHSTYTRPSIGKAFLRNLETGVSHLMWESSSVVVKTLALSPDGQWLALAKDIGPVELHRIGDPPGLGQDRIEPRMLESGEMYALAFSPDSRLLAMGGLNGRIELWDTTNWRKRQTLIGHLSWVTDMKFSPDTNVLLLATTSRDSTVRLWDVGQLERGEFLPFHATPHACDPDWETALYVDLEEGTYTIRNIATDSIQSKQPLPYFATNALGSSIALGPGGRSVAVALTDRSIRLWDPAENGGKGQQGWALPTSAVVGRMRFSADGRLLVGWGGARMWIWDVPTRREVAFATNSWNNNWYHRPQFTADQRQLIIPFGKEGDVCLWDFGGSGKIIPLKGRHPHCMSVALSPDGTTLATGNWDGTVKLWDMASREEIRAIGGRALRLIGVTFTPDGRRVLASNIDEITVWDVTTGSEVCNLRGDPPVGGLLVFQDPDTLIAGLRTGTHRLHAPSFEEIEAAVRTQNSESRVQK